MREKAARYVDRRTAVHDDGITSRERNSATAGGELGDVAFDDGEVACQVAERSSHPGTPVIHAGGAQVHNERQATQGRIPLHRRVGQLGAAHGHGEKVLHQGNKTVDRPAYVDDRAFVEINLPSIEKKPLTASRQLKA